MDLKECPDNNNWLVVGTAERHLLIYNLSNPQQEYRKDVSPLKFQTRSIGLFNDGLGYAVGSIEGRVGIQYFKEILGITPERKNFAFKCHRTDDKNPPPQSVFSVNSICFNSQGTFATAGSDGAYNFWDKDSKTRLKNYKAACCPISASAFSADSSVYAYAVSYDWSKGVEHYNTPTTNRNMVLLHATSDSDIRKKPRAH